MKRLLSLFLCLITVLPASGCASAIEKRERNLSELRDELMIASSDKMKVTLISGEREDPFVIDGTPGEKTSFSVITITPHGFSDNAEFAYTAYIGEEKLEGKFSRHPYKNTYSVELVARAVGSAAVTVTSDGYAENFELKSVKTDDMISASVALETAEIRLKDRIKELTAGGELKAEIYVRFTENPISGDGGYYWYVAFVPEKYTVYAVLIDPVTKEIAAIRE